MYSSIARRQRRSGEANRATSATPASGKGLSTSDDRRDKNHAPTSTSASCSTTLLNGFGSPTLGQIVLVRCSLKPARSPNMKCQGLGESVADRSGARWNVWFTTRLGRLGTIDATGTIHGHAFPAFDGHPIWAIASDPDSFWLAVSRRGCDRVWCPYPRDHSLIIRVSRDYSSETVTDVGAAVLFYGSWR